MEDISDICYVNSPVDNTKKEIITNLFQKQFFSHFQISTKVKEKDRQNRKNSLIQLNNKFNVVNLCKKIGYFD